MGNMLKTENRQMKICGVNRQNAKNQQRKAMASNRRSDSS